MSFDIDLKELEKEAERARNKNNELLFGFKKHLQSTGLKDKTIRGHLDNVDFYINTFLLYYDNLEVKHGCYNVGSFLGEWFIKKAMWSSVASIKSNIASFKKFYKYLLSIGEIDKDDYIELYETIEFEKDDWFDKMRRYDDPNEKNPFFLY